jgi:hypothetical protein
MTEKRIFLIANSRILWAGFSSLISGFLFLGFYIFQDQIKSTSDLTQLEGKINYCSIMPHSKTSSAYSYFVHLDNFENKFKIIEGFVDYFNRTDFDRNVKKGDLIKIYISNNDYKNIRKLSVVNIYGLTVNDTEYLNSNKCVSHHNSILPLYGGLGFILLGLIILYFKRDIFSRR